MSYHGIISYLYSHKFTPRLFSLQISMKSVPRLINDLLSLNFKDGPKSLPYMLTIPTKLCRIGAFGHMITPIGIDHGHELQFLVHHHHKAPYTCNVLKKYSDIYVDTRI